METGQIRLYTLLKDDPYFRKFFTTPPKPLRVVHFGALPWRLIVQKEKGGRWFKKDYRTYAEAFHAVKPRLSEYWDMTIHCKPQGFNAPVVKVGKKRIWLPVPPEHRWCIYCRRPTVFIHCYRHHMMKYQVNVEEARCLMCGARAKPMREFHSPELWPLPAAQLSRSSTERK